MVVLVSIYDYYTIGCGSTQSILRIKIKNYNFNHNTFQIHFLPFTVSVYGVWLQADCSVFPVPHEDSQSSAEFWIIYLTSNR